MKLSNHSAVAIRAAALVLLLARLRLLRAKPPNLPSGKMLTQAGVDSIVDSIGAVWTLGPRDPLIDGGAFPTKARNGVVDGSQRSCATRAAQSTPVATWQTAGGSGLTMRFRLKALGP